MKAENFKWWATRYITVDDLDYDHEFDMHNNFDFRHITYNPENCKAELEWQRCAREGVPSDLPKSIIITMSSVTELIWSPRDEEMPFSEDTCLSSFGYWDRSGSLEDQIWVECMPDPNWHWSFAFQSGATLVVAGESASITVIL